MRTIDIDDEVFAHLQNHAVAYVETPNHTLRRLLGLKEIKQATTSVSKARSTAGDPARISKKNPKTNLRDLISAGLLHEGQLLHLVDYQGGRIPGCEAIISGKGLSWNGALYSMSELAKILLQRVGFQSDSVRGPAHWGNSDGVTVMALWDEYLKGRRMRHTD